jgi:hypothetical protein
LKNINIPIKTNARLDQVFAGVLIQAPIIGSSQRPIGDKVKFSQGLLIFPGK